MHTRPAQDARASFQARSRTATGLPDSVVQVCVEQGSDRVANQDAMSVAVDPNARMRAAALEGVEDVAYPDCKLPRCDVSAKCSWISIMAHRMETRPTSSRR